MRSQFTLPPLPPYPIENDPPRLTVPLADLPPYPSAGEGARVVRASSTPVALAGKASPYQMKAKQTAQSSATPGTSPHTSRGWPSMDLHELEDLHGFSESPVTVAKMVGDAAIRPAPLGPKQSNAWVLTVAHIAAAAPPGGSWAPYLRQAALPSPDAESAAGSPRRLLVPAQSDGISKYSRTRPNPHGPSCHTVYRQRVNALLKAATPQMKKQAEVMTEQRMQAALMCGNPYKMPKRRYRLKRSLLLKMMRQLPQEAPTPPQAAQAQSVPAGVVRAPTQGLPSNR